MNMNVKRNVIVGALAGLLLTGGTAWAIAANQPAPVVVTSGESAEAQPVFPRAETLEHREVVAPVQDETVEPAPVDVIAEPAPVAPAPAPAPVAPPAPAPAPAPALGMPVPWIPQPGNAEGGYWDTTACPSGSASVASDGVVRCD